nr:hypothetical protein [uncultured Duganella sp.]
MATGLLGTIASSGTMTYTAQNAGRLRVTSASTSTTATTTSINGAVAIAMANAYGNGVVEHHLAQGQTVTITNSAGVTSVVSVLEEF